MLKTSLSAIMALVMILSCCALAFAASEIPESPHGDVLASGKCGAEGSDVDYILYSDGTLKVNGIGAIKSFAFSGASEGWCMPVNMLHKIKSVEIGDGITEIGYSAFGFSLLENIDLGNTVEIIDECAFMECCYFEKLTLPESVKTVAEGAFACCKGMTEITLGSNVEYVGDRAFFDCYLLKKVVFLNGNTVLDNDPIVHHKPWGGAETYHPGFVTVYSYAGGSVEAYANDSGFTFVDLTPMDAEGHIWSEGAVTAEPNCTAEGEIIYTCSLCDDVKRETVPALGHTEPDSHGNCERCGEHLIDVCPWCGGQHTGGFYQSILGWLHNMLASIFGAKY